MKAYKMRCICICICMYRPVFYKKKYHFAAPNVKKVQLWILRPKRKRIKFTTRKRFKCELNAVEIRSIKANTNYGIIFA